MKIAVVIPCYRVQKEIIQVISNIGEEVNYVFVVDDNCPQKSGRYVEENCSDRRVTVIFHDNNKGVGGAVITGYKAALETEAEIVIKLDGDGQADPKLIPTLIHPIINGHADYTKGNRFFDYEGLNKMPLIRMFGNSVLSFVSKAASGYWNIMDPTNGFTAIHTKVLRLLPLNKIAKDYFFESEMLFRLNTVRAVVQDIPMAAVYGSEESSLKISKVIRDFPKEYLACFLKRIFYNYYLRDFNVCSIELLLGTLSLLAGSLYGIEKWISNSQSQIFTSAGQVMLAVLPIILGFQMILSAINFDLLNVPNKALHKLL